jgi:arsenate reductase
MESALAPSRRAVLFLCTGNSCRSQMAEAIVNSGRAGEWEAFSAGSRPAGFVHPLAVRVLSEIGIELRGARSKPVAEFHGKSFDLVVTVCSSAAEECPVWLGQGRRLHQEYPDPAKAKGDEHQVLAAFRSVRDAMLRDLPALLQGQR